KNIDVKVEASILSKSGDNKVYIILDDGLETLKILLYIPFERNVSAKITITYSEDEDDEIVSKFGNARDVSLDHDLNIVSQIISAGMKEVSSILYINNKLKDVFGKKKRDKRVQKIDQEDRKKFTINTNELSEIIQRANDKGAGIIKWTTTPNKKIILKYTDKKDEYYGSEAETSVHLYYAYMLKNQEPSKRIF
ncbi:MAG: hypothetical protein JXQ66_07775, partial [Campylobacterales bacterium]|nr:hypothetical protein [Campylobacterales bacterium]